MESAVTGVLATDDKNCLWAIKKEFFASTVHINSLEEGRKID